MMHPALKNYWYATVYVGLFVLLGLGQVVAFSPLINLPLGWLITDGMLFGLLFGVLGIPLWMVVQFVDFSKGSIYQQMLNMGAMCVLTISCWLGLGLFLLYNIFPEKSFVLLLPSIPARVFIGVLLYIGSIQFYGNMIRANKELEEINEESANSVVEQQEKKNEELSDTTVELIDRVAVKLGTKIHVVNVPDIMYLQAEGDYVMLHAAEGNYLKEQTMKYFEQHLPQNRFVRVHRSCIVNVEMISRVELFEKQNYLLVLQNGEKLKTSTNGYKLLKKVLSL
jgi:hypothetical protein